MKIAEKIVGKQDREGMLRRSLERIVQLYTDKTHFVYELLQNAEDSGATSIKFIQYDDRLEVMHNGHPFTEENLQGLCDIGKSDKVNNLNQIGEFGVGFKSVYGICEVVKLYSQLSEKYTDSDCRPFAVEIRDFTRPIDIDTVSFDDKFTTLFVFPYAAGYSFSGYKNITELKYNLKNGLKKLNSTTLLFMKSLKNIEYLILADNENISKICSINSESVNDHCYFIEDNSDEKSNILEKEGFLRFSRIINNRVSARTIDIAFPVTINKNGVFNFRKPELPFISVYFPTETESKLDFIVQGPFRTTPNRSSVPADDKDNIELTRIVCELLKDSIIELRDKGWLNYSFINLLPLKEDNFNIFGLFKPVYNLIKDLFNSDDIIPAHNGGYVSAYSALIAYSKGLLSLFDDKKISELIEEKYKWVSAEVTLNGRYRSIYEYFNSCLKIKTVRPQTILDFINNNYNFLPGVSDAWLNQFYALLEKNPHLFIGEETYNYLFVDFVKTQNGSFQAPYEKSFNGPILNVFLPVGKEIETTVNCVDSEIYNSNKSFFKNVLGLEKPGRYEYFIGKIKNRYSKTVSLSEEEHIKDLKEIASFLRNTDIHEEVWNSIRHGFALRCKHGDDVKYVTVDNYITVSKTGDGFDIEAYFKNIGNGIWFLDLDFYRCHNISNEELSLLGVKFSIARYDDVFEGDYAYKGLRKIPKWHAEYDFTWGLCIKLLDEALRFIATNPDNENSREKSAFIFKFLQKNRNRLCGNIHIDRKDVKDLENEESAIIKILKNQEIHECCPASMFKYYWANNWNGKWLFDKYGRLVRPCEIKGSELAPELYDCSYVDDGLFKLLGFKVEKKEIIDSFVTDCKNMTSEQKDMFFELELMQRFGISAKNLARVMAGKKEKFEESENFDFQFPTLKVKNWDRLKKHVEAMLTMAVPVNYVKKLRRIRVSRNGENVRAYLKDMYGNDYNNEIACQMCHKPNTKMVACQLNDDNEFELGPMNLCLCPNCAQEYHQVRKKNKKDIFDGIFKLSEYDISMSDIVKIEFDSKEIWFTQTHIAEIREILGLLNALENSEDDFLDYLDI